MTLEKKISQVEEPESSINLYLAIFDKLPDKISKDKRAEIALTLTQNELTLQQNKLYAVLNAANSDVNLLKEEVKVLKMWQTKTLEAQNRAMKTVKSLKKGV